MFIIAGLGNPTLQYRGTRHNVGFDVIDTDLYEPERGKHWRTG